MEAPVHALPCQARSFRLRHPPGIKRHSMAAIRPSVFPIGQGGVAVLRKPCELGARNERSCWIHAGNSSTNRWAWRNTYVQVPTLDSRKCRYRLADQRKSFVLLARPSPHRRLFEYIGTQRRAFLRLTLRSTLYLLRSNLTDPEPVEIPAGSLTELDQLPQNCVYTTSRSRHRGTHFRGNKVTKQWPLYQKELPCRSSRVFD